MISRDVCVTNPGDPWGVGWGQEPSDAGMWRLLPGHTWTGERGGAHLTWSPAHRLVPGVVPWEGQEWAATLKSGRTMLETDLRVIWVPGPGRLVWLSERPGPHVNTGAADLVLEAPGRWYLSCVELGTRGRPRPGTWGGGRGFLAGRAALSEGSPAPRSCQASRCPEPTLPKGAALEETPGSAPYLETLSLG